MDQLTGHVIIDAWRDGHPHGRSCPKCSEDLTTTALMDLAYRFETCECFRHEYPHLFEQMWHLACLSDAAPEIHHDQLLRDLAYALKEPNFPRRNRSAFISRIEEARQAVEEAS